MVQFLTYSFVSLFYLFVYFDFVSDHRCFTREPGRSYLKYWGIDFDHSFTDVLSCYAHWCLTTWLILPIISLIGIIVYLASERSSSVRITAFIMGATIFWVIIFSFATVREGHSSLVGG